MNVIWIVSDTLRRDAVGAYGNEKMHTPAIDALAAKSVRFDRHYVASFPTMPARADFMTGRWTISFMNWEPLPRTELALAELLANSGVNTAAIVDTPFFVRDSMGYDRGFVTFNEIPGQNVWSIGDRRLRRGAPDVRPKYRLDSDCCARQTFLKAMQWLELNYKEDFFLYIDTWDPHEAWNAPVYYTELYWPGYDGELVPPNYGYWQDIPGFTEEKLRKSQATYLGEVTMVDTWVGNFMRQVENMGLIENTAIIFTTDHGYYFGEHGGLFGKMVLSRPAEQEQGGDTSWSRSPLYEEVTALPLLIYMPGVSPWTYGGLTSAVDLMPTVLDIMDQEIPSRVEGRSLLPMIKDPSLPGREYAFSSASFTNIGDIDLSVDNIGRRVGKASLATITTNEWSLIYDVEPGGSELFNLKSDPNQEKNVISENPDKARQLHQIFVKHMRDTNVDKRFVEPRLELRL